MQSVHKLNRSRSMYRLAVIGCGGTGSALIGGLPFLHQALTAIRKSVQKERSQAHLSSTAMLPDEVQRAAVARFVNDWAAAAGKRSYFGGNNLAKFGSISFDFITAAHKQLQQAVERALRQQTDKTLLEYVNAKDEINHRYDAEQAESDAEFQKYAKGAEDARADSLNAARRATPPVVTASTSLEGDALITLPPGAYVLYAEDTTTDHHYRWALPLPVRIRDHTIELTDANALKATAEDVASATAQPSYPKASALTATQQAEYSLRYGSRLLGSWNRICVSSNKTSPPDDRLLLTDSPLGFGFAVSCATDSVFNTLRMNDNDIAARIFRDYVAPYLSGIPADLKSTGGSQAFEAVTVKVLTSSKSFADEYAVGNFFWLDYVFRIADVESFAYQKIDAQQLLDRGHITNDRIGRITVKLVGAN